MENATLNSRRDTFYRTVLDVADDLDLAVPITLQALHLSDRLICTMRLDDNQAAEVARWAKVIGIEVEEAEVSEGAGSWTSVNANGIWTATCDDVRVWSKCDRP